MPPVEETPREYSRERADKETYDWLTEGGTVKPNTTPPRVRVSGVVAGDLDAADDEVTVYGAEDGGSGTRRPLNVDASGRVRVVGAGASGSAVAGNPILAAGSDGTNARTIKTDSTGTVQVDIESGTVDLSASTLSALETITAELEGDTADLDSGAGSDPHGVVALGVPASGGHAVITGDATNGLDVDVTRSALPTGASTLAEQQSQTTHLSNAATSLSVLDDWDEADRAKVSLIASQVGVAGGSATTTSNTLRVTVATDNVVSIDDNGSTISIDDGAGSITVDGTVDLGATTLSALESITVQNGAGASAVNIQDGGNSITVDGTVDLGASSLAALETITAELEGDTADLDSGAGSDAHGVVAIGLPASGGHVVGGTSTNPLRTDPTGTTTQPVSAASLPLPTGAATLAEQQTQTASLSILDDWDESDRAKVNLIVGQAGVAAGSGTASATTQRVTIATDDVVSIDDNGGSLTVDGTVAATQSGSWSVTADTELTTADLDTGAGTDTRAVVGIAGTASGGAQLIPGSSTDGLLVNLGANNDVTVTSGSVTADTELPAAAALADNAANPTAPAVGAFGMLWDGATWDRAPGNATDGVLVNLGANNDVTFSGTVNTQGTVAHDGIDSGNPVKIGGRAVAHGATPTEVAAADRADLLTNRMGVPFVMGGVPNVITREYRWDTAQTNDDCLEAISAGTKIVVTSILMTSGSAGTASVKARVGFGATTVPAEPADGASVAGMVLSHAGVIPGGGVVRGDGSGILGIGGDGEELRITADAPTSGSCRLIVTYYLVAS